MQLTSQQLKDDSVTKDKVIALLEEANQRANRLEEQIIWLKRQVFGRSSEKISKEELNPNQGYLFNEVEVIDEVCPEPDESLVIPEHKRKKKGRKKIDKDLPRVEVIHDLPEHEKVCSKDGAPLKRIGEITSEQVDYIPAKVRVLKHIRYKYACSCCGENIKTADKPKTLLPKSLASPSLLAHITTAKYVDSLPLYRQEKQFARLGIQLNRATMASWMIKIGGTHVQPLINLLNEECRKSPLLHIDETRVQVLKSPKSPTADHWIWVRANGATDHRVVLFDYDTSRTAAVAKHLLDEFSGILVSDGYKAYDGIAKDQKLPHAGCWAHARRKFYDAYKSSKGTSETAKTALKMIKDLYKVERQCRELYRYTGGRDKEKEHRREKAILAFRKKYCEPIVKAFEKWLDTTVPKAVPNSDIGKALQYALNQWPKLTTFLNHALAPLDNNRAEGAIRPFVIGRRNWMFCDTQKGAAASAHLYSLVETAKANGLEPHAYLTEVYEKLPLATSLEDIEALLPWNVSC